MPETPTVPESSGSQILQKEAVAAYTSRNIIREALTTRIAQDIRAGRDPEKLLDLLDRLSKPDELSEKLLTKLL